MPRATGTTFSDLVGKLDMLVVECPEVQPQRPVRLRFGHSTTSMSSLPTRSPNAVPLERALVIFNLSVALAA